jgi:CheY-like chemotaxis protein
MDGLTATRHIRACEDERGSRGRKSCTIIALTGLASKEARQEAFLSGVDTFITKPVKLMELNRVLTKGQSEDGTSKQAQRELLPRMDTA